MADAKYRFCLTDDEKRELNQMVSSGKRNARQVLDALILLNCDESEGKKQSDEIIGGFLKVGKLRVHRVRKRFFENGMSGVFNLPHGGGRSKQIDGDFEAHLIALSCREPPEGHSQWSLRLLADKMVELEYVESVSHETVRQALKKTNSSDLMMKNFRSFVTTKCLVSCLKRYGKYNPCVRGGPNG